MGEYDVNELHATCSINCIKEETFSDHNITLVIAEADGYQSHLIAPEQGYCRLIEYTLITIKPHAESAVDAVHGILKDLVCKSIKEATELKQYPSLKDLR
ncbi:hypothetical protein L1987_32735 [Smallanthus sonchifolius]|uniref:Uncharacterized protein n=1 Tax=Smallanthus sonchifolius TaxID=185202 RepID=A0ACB9HQ95_9ASTR|nr:hypothetical protein L1987_32735 [Smallanthus sonchifolius]